MEDLSPEVWAKLKIMVAQAINSHKDGFKLDFAEMESRGLYRGYEAYCELHKNNKPIRWKAYCYQAIKNGIVDAYRYTKRKNTAFESLMGSELDFNAIKDTSISELKEWIKSKLNGFEYEIFSERYYDKTIIKKIAEKHNISKSKLGLDLIKVINKLQHAYCIEFGITMPLKYYKGNIKRRTKYEIANQIQN